MKLKSGAEAFVSKPDPNVRAVLLYGPDAGLIRERMNGLTRAVAGSVDDPFRVSEFLADSLREDPARLRDEAAAISFGGGKRVVRVRDATDTVAEIFTKFLEDPVGDALVVVTSDDLSPRSKLRAAFEKAGVGAALPCYADDSQTLENLVRATLKGAGLTISADALAWLVDRLGSDRDLTRRELEKLVLYMGAPGEITEDDVAACVGDTAGLGTDELIFALGDGDQVTIQRIYARMMAEGTSPISLLSGVARHIMRLHETRGRLADGKNMDQAAAMLRPPVFFKFKGRFFAQARKWTEPLLARALEIIAEAEVTAKSTDMPAEAVIERAFMQLAQVGRGGARR